MGVAGTRRNWRGRRPTEKWCHGSGSQHQSSRRSSSSEYDHRRRKKYILAIKIGIWDGGPLVPQSVNIKVLATSLNK
ncbi:hypothetical protein YC2023_066830 [Brassica napus]